VQKAVIKPPVWIIAVMLVKLQANVLKLVNKNKRAGVKSRALKKSFRIRG
jgi:hypothetical protein